MKNTTIVLPILLSLSLAACGGGSSDAIAPTPGSAAPITPPVAPPVAPAAPQAAVLSGRFVDSAVSGLRYQTDTQEGETDANGTFQYSASESVVFSIGDIVFPAVTASDLITPLSIFNTDNIAQPEVINLARLLQTLDTDGNAENGINISDQAHANATGLSVDFASAGFDNQVINLVANSGSVQTVLIEGEPALDHLAITLQNEGVIQAPVEPGDTSEPVASSGECDVTSSFTGNTSSFSSFAHDISGTLTVVDGCTLRIDNFNYDGGGPSVFFYLGAGGDFSASGAGLPIGPQLNGRRYTNETITVDLPAGVDLSNFDAVSVWCDIFFADFGNASL